MELSKKYGKNQMLKKKSEERSSKRDFSKTKAKQLKEDLKLRDKEEKRVTKKYFSKVKRKKLSQKRFKNCFQAACEIKK